MALFRCSSGGGTSAPTKTGTISLTTSNQKIVTNFEPKYISLVFSNGTAAHAISYNADISTTKCLVTATQSSAGWVNLGSGSIVLASVDSDGFTVRSGGSTYSGNYNYFVIG